MNIFSFDLSIKWKLSLALIISGLSLVLGYVAIAKNVFESDKISYVFEAQNSHLNSLKREIDHRFEQTLMSSKALLSTLDSSNKLSSAGTNFFNEDKSVLAIELWDDLTNKSIFKVEKKPGILSPKISNEILKPGEIKVTPVEQQNFLLSYNIQQGQSPPILVRILMAGHDLVPQADSHQPVLLVGKGGALLSEFSLNVETELAEELAQQFGDISGENTKIWKFKSKKFLVSSAQLSLSHFKIITFTSEKEALGALKVLFIKSMVFLILSGLGLVIISLLLAKQLTSNLQTLTLAATEIGKGNFNQLPTIKSKDEMGVLARAFGKMSKEIIRLIEETRDKGRMESELKTAKLVQDTLFPEKKASRQGLQIYGQYEPASECGGDWWYYFEHQGKVFLCIGDVTGHGAPAALITSAARSAVSMIEVRELLTPSQFLTLLNRAVFQASKGHIQMTFVVACIDPTQQVLTFSSASHDPPYLIRQSAEPIKKKDLEALMATAPGARLGQDLDSQYSEDTLDFRPGDRLFFYTDGLMDVQNPAGENWGERNMLKNIVASANSAKSAEDFAVSMFNEAQAFRQNSALIDDVTFIVCQFTESKET